MTTRLQPHPAVVVADLVPQVELELGVCPHGILAPAREDRELTPGVRGDVGRGDLPTHGCLVGR